MRAAVHGRRNGHAHVDFRWHLPIDLAGDRIERADRRGMPDDQLPHAGCLMMVGWL